VLWVSEEEFAARQRVDGPASEPGLVARNHRAEAIGADVAVAVQPKLEELASCLSGASLV
jgi:hypothetical protein